LSVLLSAQRVDVDGLAERGVDVGGLVGHDLGVRPAHVAPIVGAVARDVHAVDEAVALAAHIYNIYGAVGELADFGLHPVHLLGREVAAAGDGERAQAVGGGLVVGVGEERRLVVGRKFALAGAPVLRLLSLVLAFQSPAVGGILRPLLGTHVVAGVGVVQVLVHWLLLPAADRIVVVRTGGQCCRRRHHQRYGRCCHQILFHIRLRV